MDYQGIDARSLRLIIELQFEDLMFLDKGKHKLNQPMSDSQLAMSLYKTELERLVSITADQAICRSISNTVLADGMAIAAHNEVELQARRDQQQALGSTTRRETATSVAGPSTNLPIRTPDAKRTASTTKTTPARCAKVDHQRTMIPLLMEGITSATTNEKTKTKTPLTGESSKSSVEGKRSAKKGSSLYNCVACSEAIPYNDITYSACTHSYCKDCLVNLFESSMTDESLFPPKCCSKQISFELNKKFFTETLCSKFQEKSVEFATPDRTYCHIKSCSAFIPPDLIIVDMASCGRCYSLTCTRCKGPYHPGACAEDPTTQEMLRIAKENGWQRCYSCHRMVELASGCHHITCMCKAQFCYVCGNKWKTCKCEQWDERRLLERAERVADRNMGTRGINPTVRALRIERERTNLRRNHQCQHDTWVFRHGSHICEECYDMLPNFVYECGRCRIMACRRCRYNRL